MILSNGISHFSTAAVAAAAAAAADAVALLHRNNSLSGSSAFDSILLFRR